MAVNIANNEKHGYYTTTSPSSPPLGIHGTSPGQQMTEVYPSPSPHGTYPPNYQQPQYAQGHYQHAPSPQQQYQQGQYFPQLPTQQGQFVAQPTPLISLSQSPALVRCPRCGNVAGTAATSRIGNTNHAWGAFLCFFFGLGCIPYLIDSLRDVEHRCSSCGTHLATWHRSGRTVVHAF